MYNILFKLLSEYDANVRSILDSGEVIEVDGVEFNDDNKPCTIRVGVNTMIDGELFAVKSMFAHPESGCAWFYIQHIQSGQWAEASVSYEKVFIN